MTDAGTRPSRLDSLTGLRWFAAFAVFFHHFTNFAPVPDLSTVAVFGITGVSFFFVLSGFVLTWSQTDRDTTGRFYWRRFARIYPLVLVTTLACLPVFYGSAHTFQKPWDPAPILLSLLLLHAWFAGLPLIFFGGNPASWSLSCEAFFYAVFPHAVRRLLHRRVAVLLLGAVGCVVVMWGLLAAVASYPLGLVPGTQVSVGGLLLGSPVGRLWEFGLGVLVGCAVRAGWRPPVGLWTAVGLLAGGMALLVVWQQHPGWSLAFVPPTSAKNQVTAPLYALVIAAAASRDVRGAPSFLRHPVLVRLGHWSYAFYLTHVIVIYGARLAFGQQVRGYDNLVWLPAVLLVAIAVAGLCYHVVEHPVERLLRSKMKPLPPRAPQARTAPHLTKA